jgi:hypothetical protein
MDRKDIDTLINEAVAAEVEDAKQAGRIGYMGRAVVQATLPHKETEGGIFRRQNGSYKLTVMSPSGLPYGSIPRLLLSWMTTEAVYTRSPVLELGPTLSAFMAELGLGRTGGKTGAITRLRNQTVRLLSSAISCQYTDEINDQGKQLFVAKEYNLWWNPKAPNQMPLWKSTITLSPEFFSEIIDRPVPVDMSALKALKRSPMELDIYCWLTYRMSYLKKDTVIPWPYLQLQFGSNYAETAQGLRDFKKKFLLRLKKVHGVYDAAKVFDVENGLLLKPSPPHVAKMPVPMLPGSRRRPAANEEVAEKFAALLASDDVPIRLRTETFEKAREAAPRFDIYFLENEWREWIAKKGERPKDPDKAFIGFCRQKAKQHGGG